MELHSSMSLDKELQSSSAFGGSAGGIVGAGGRMTSWVPEQESSVAAKNVGSETLQPLAKTVSEAKDEPSGNNGASASEHQAETDGNESTGSPRSFDSQSSIDDKISSSIRNRPIPKELKSFEPDTEAEMASAVAAADEEDTMDSTASSSTNNTSNQPTSNLVAPDSLRKGSGGGGVQQPISQIEDSPVTTASTNNTSSAAPHSLEDLISKDNKTLNVNVLAEGEEDQVKNNELSFDSEKFCRRRCSEKVVRPRPQVSY